MAPLVLPPPRLKLAKDKLKINENNLLAEHVGGCQKRRT
jgi:hypothetical protein